MGVEKGIPLDLDPGTRMRKGMDVTGLWIPSGRDPTSATISGRDWLSAQIDCLPVFTVTENIKLGKQIRMLKKQIDFENLRGRNTSKNNKRLYAEYKNTVLKLATGNLRLVLYALNELFPIGSPISEQTREDLFQEGYFALLNAARLYNPRKGSFAGYAMPGIRRVILRVGRIEQYQGTMPGGLIRFHRAYVRAESEIRAFLKREGTDDEIYQYASLLLRLNEGQTFSTLPTRSEVKKYFEEIQTYFKGGGNEETTKWGRQFQHFRQRIKLTRKFDTMRELDAGVTFQGRNPETGELEQVPIVDSDEIEPIVTVDFDRRFLKQALMDAINSLQDGRHRKAIIMYSGLEDGVERTFVEIGHTLGITPERVRQIISTALRAMRRADKSQNHLSDFSLSKHLH